MPCNSDHMNPSGDEHEISRVLCVIDEHIGNHVKDSWWKGYHPTVYNRGMSKSVRDKYTEQACRMCRTRGTAALSLEAQVWWREHQRMDVVRQRRERQAKKDKAEKELALSKLTSREKKLLGV